MLMVQVQVQLEALGPVSFWGGGRERGENIRLLTEASISWLFSRPTIDRAVLPTWYCLFIRCG